MADKIWLPFNVNEYVRVQLTDHGRELHRQNYDIQMEKLRPAYDWNPWEYKPVEEDANGWSEWQLWVLMQEFGPHIHNGCKMPYKTILQVGHDGPARTSEAVERRVPARTSEAVERRVPEGTRDLDMEEA